jgi:selenophosphate synthase
MNEKPDCSGFFVARIFHDRAESGICQLLPSAVSSSATDIQNSLNAGFYAHLTKPLGFDLLHTTIQKGAQEADCAPTVCAD